MDKSERVRALLSEHNREGNLLRNRTSGSFALLLENNARMHSNKEARICVFRLLKQPFPVYIMERGLFNDMFEIDNSDNAISALIDWFEFTDNTKTKR